MQIEGSCQGCHGGWIRWLVVHVQLCSCFGVSCERLTAFITTLHQSAEGPAAIGGEGEGLAVSGGEEESPAAI